ncbi:MAG: helix-turn-helix transcriptional regulator [Alphaproteobacteria bacterium]
MLRHADIWHAIDRLAMEHGFTPSGLARRSGLDPTTFNKSKRVTRDGKPRWPSTESIAKVLEATDSTFSDFARHAGGKNAVAQARRIPVLGYAQAGANGFFDDAGYPVGSGWDEIAVPELDDPHAYALEINGDSMQPVYRDGDVIIVSPGANLRRGDRLVVKTKAGEVLAKQLFRQTAHKIELQSLNPAHPDRTLGIEDIAWMARIIWASQ